MSGHKHATVSISQDEYQRLHETEMRLRFLQPDTPTIIKQIDQEATHRLEQDYQALAIRQEQFIESLAGVHGNIQELEQAASQALLDQQAEIQGHFIDMTDQVLEQAGTLIDDIEKRYQSQLQEIQEHRHQELAWLAHQDQSLTHKQRQKNALALQWLKAASAIQQFIHENYDHQRFTPGKLEQLNKNLMQAQQNLHVGLPEAALVSAQQAYTSLSDLRLELEKLHSEFQLLLETARTRTLGLYEQAKANRRVPAIDLDGNQLEIDLNIDYWVGGELARLIHLLHGQYQILDQRSQDLTNTDLRTLIEQTLPDWENRLYELIHQARIAAINSQLRKNIAGIAVEALFGQGYVLQDTCYESDDMRQAYYAHLVNFEGSQVIVQVDPFSDQSETTASPAWAGQNELHIFTSEAQQKTTHELRHQASEIRYALQQNGLEVGAIHAVSEGQDPGNSYRANRPSSPHLTQPDREPLHRPVRQRR